MIVSGNVDVKHMETIGFAQIISQVYEARGGCFGHAIVNHHDILIEVVFVFLCSCIEQRQKVV